MNGNSSTRTSNLVGFAFAAIGVILMALAIEWRINPVEGSVVPEFLNTGIGLVMCWILWITCMPVWLLVVSLQSFIPASEPMQYTLGCAAMLLLQAVVYFFLGKLVAFLAKRRNITER